MSPDSHLANATPGEHPSHEDVQQLIEAERGTGASGVLRTWLASDSVKATPTDPGRVVLVSDASGVKISRDNGTTAPTNVINVGTPAGGSLTGTYPDPTLSTATVDALVPPGTVMGWAGVGVTPPAGWLPCNGAPAPTATYPKLFAVIGYTYGGSGGVNLPNLIGRVLLMEGPGHARGDVGGAESVAGPSHTHTGSHSHGLNSHTHGPGLHTHDLNGHAHTMSSHTHGIGVHSHGLNGHTHGPGSHTHDLNHDHANAVGAAAASSSTLNGRFTAGGVNALPDAHTHDVNLPSLGSVASGTPSASNTGAPSPTTDTAGPSANGTDIPSTPNTGTTSGPTATPTANATDAATGTTATDSSAPAATASTVATMPPFLTMSYIIRAG